MCGICGIVSRQGISREVLERMTATLRHRGPDDAGYFVDSHCALGHRRLSIIDLRTGSQPILNEDESLAILFNGEIYNFLELRAGLEERGHRLKTRTDTEAILHLFEEEGEACVEELRGMFSFAIWDRNRRRLVAARDRLGKKPLYYTTQAGLFAFASELKALKAVPGLSFTLDPQAVDDFLSLQYVPSPRTIFREVRKLPPAHILTVQADRLEVHRYWEPPSRQEDRSEEHWIEDLRSVVEEAVRLRLVSDVPIGAFLSGGVDSSIVVALMSRLSGTRVKTFSIGFSDPAYDELRYARLVAEKYATDHRELRVEPRAAEALPTIVEHYDEPFGDSSALPTYYVAKLGAEFVKVALTGDGGDESFAGYERYAALKLSLILDRWPPLKLLARPLAAIPASAQPKTLRRKLKRFAGSLRLSAEERYISWMCFFSEAERAALYRPEFQKALEGHAGEGFLRELYRAQKGADALHATLLLDLKSYLPEDLLVKMDRASMANSLEARSPLLDHKVVELAARMPAGLRLKGLKGKHMLKRAFGHLLPTEILHRPKMGFGVPVSRWFRGELRELLSDSILSSGALSLAYFQRSEIQRLVEEHIEGRADHGAKLWLLLMFELWHRRWLPR